MCKQTIGQSTDRIVVMGAGLTGCSVALELADQGYYVDLYDRYAEPMLGASLRNEGKIHLGFVYAAAPDFTTAQLQLRGALTFSSLLRRWIGEQEFSSIGISTPFAYLVDEESLLTQTELEHHYTKVSNYYFELCLKFPNLDYMGKLPDRLWSAAPEALINRWFLPDNSIAYNTQEVAVDTNDLATVVRNAVLENKRIEFIGGLNVETIERRDEGFQLHPLNSKHPINCNVLVNCTWDSRLYFDQMMGLDSPAELLHRLKYRLIAQAPDIMHMAPSATRVLGPFGDVVVRPNGTLFLSWYPAGLRGWSNQILPPVEWSLVMQGIVDDDTASEISAEIVSGIADWYPAIRHCEILQVDAGPIVAWGVEDVDKPGSGLHCRDQIGSWHSEGYWTVEPGKLTTAPLAAYECARRIVSSIQEKKDYGPTFSDSLLNSI